MVAIWFVVFGLREVEAPRSEVVISDLLLVGSSVHLDLDASEFLLVGRVSSAVRKGEGEGVGHGGRGGKAQNQSQGHEQTLD